MISLSRGFLRIVSILFHFFESRPKTSNGDFVAVNGDLEGEDLKLRITIVMNAIGCELRTDTIDSKDLHFLKTHANFFSFEVLESLTNLLPWRLRAKKNPNMFLVIDC